MSIRTAHGRVDSTTVKFPINPSFQLMAGSGKSVHFVHDDGVYLACWLDPKDKPLIVRATDDGGMEAGYGDDFGEDLGPLTIPEGATEFHITVTETHIKSEWYGNFGPAPAKALKGLIAPSGPSAPGKTLKTVAERDLIVLHKTKTVNGIPGVDVLYVQVKGRDAKGLIEGYITNKETKGALKRGTLVKVADKDVFSHKPGHFKPAPAAK
jgi:hypothetical protein